MMTEIHAQVSIFNFILLRLVFEFFFPVYFQPQKCKGFGLEGPLAKKHASDKKLTAEKKKIIKDKKRTLKRL